MPPRWSQDGININTITNGNRIMSQTTETFQVINNELEEKAISHMTEMGFLFQGPFDTSGSTIKFSGRTNKEDRKVEKTEWYKAEQKINSKGEITLQVTYNSHHESLKSEANHVFYSGTNKALNEVKLKEMRELSAKRQREAEEKKAVEEENRKLKTLKDRERFNKASETGTSPYLERKGIKAHSIRFERKGAVGKEEPIILIPMRDDKGEIQALQEIYPSKRVFSDSSK